MYGEIKPGDKVGCVLVENDGTDCAYWFATFATMSDDSSSIVLRTGYEEKVLTNYPIILSLEAMRKVADGKMKPSLGGFGLFDQCEKELTSLCAPFSSKNGSLAQIALRAIRV